VHEIPSEVLATALEFGDLNVGDLAQACSLPAAKVGQWLLPGAGVGDPAWASFIRVWLWRQGIEIFDDNNRSEGVGPGVSVRGGWGVRWVAERPTDDFTG